MNIAAIIAEYNPFHSGHEYHIKKTREAGATHVVAVMSGNFVQRGEPALYDKYLRTKAALFGGADLVLELPLPWAMSGAQVFARGGVGIAEALGCVDTLSFGSECDSVGRLKEVSDCCSSTEFKSKIGAYLSQGVTFAYARQKAVSEMLGSDAASLLEAPNNSLAVEYLSFLNESKSTIEPFSVARMGDYNAEEPTNGFAGAAAVRNLIASGKSIEKYVPSEVLPLYSNNYADKKRIETAILCALRRLTKEHIDLAPDISEGLENRIYSAIRTSGSFEELLSAIKTKRYTLARIRRIVMSLFLGVTAESSKGAPPYIRVLGCNEKGREILAAAKPSVPLVGRASQFKKLDGRAGEIFSLECAADDIFALCFNPPKPCGEDYNSAIINIVNSF